MTLAKISSFILVCLLVSCATRSPTDLSNRDFAKKHSAYRLVTIEDNSSFASYELQPAGEIKASIAENSPILLADIFKSINNNCGFSRDDLVETRLVYHKPPTINEVWVFNDAASEFANKQTAISVLLKQLPNQGGVDITLANGCRQRPLKMMISK